MRKITVTYTLTTSQEKTLLKICEHLNKKDIDEQFNYLMNLGSTNEITNKLESFAEFYNVKEEE